MAKAMDETNGTEIERGEIKIVFAKPPAAKGKLAKLLTGLREHHRPPRTPPPVGAGVVGGRGALATLQIAMALRTTVMITMATVTTTAGGCEGPHCGVTMALQ